MAYLPKNKYKIKYTNGGEFIIKSTGELYVGNYLELPNNIFYVGTDPQLITEELKVFIPPSTNIPNTKSNALFGVLNKAYVDKEKNYTTPIASKTFPTDEDYTNGSMLRYFGQQIQTGRYFEVDKQTYSDIRSSNRIDRSIYTQGQIRWALKGDTEQINGANLLRLEKSYPNLRSLFNNLTEFKRESPNENLVAKANELVYLDGSPFPKGSKYHLHPEKGPMEGAFHKETPHRLLKFIEEKIDQTEANQVEAPTLESPVVSQPIINRPISYGGGGGY